MLDTRIISPNNLPCLKYCPRLCVKTNIVSTWHIQLRNNIQLIIINCPMTLKIQYQGWAVNIVWIYNNSFLFFHDSPITYLDIFCLSWKKVLYMTWLILRLSWVQKKGGRVRRDGGRGILVNLFFPCLYIGFFLTTNFTNCLWKYRCQTKGRLSFNVSLLFYFPLFNREGRWENEPGSLFSSMVYPAAGEWQWLTKCSVNWSHVVDIDDLSAFNGEINLLLENKKNIDSCLADICPHYPLQANEKLIIAFPDVIC